MKKYSSKQAKKGKTAYRTPSPFKHNPKNKKFHRTWGLATRLEHRRNKEKGDRK